MASENLEHCAPPEVIELLEVYLEYAKKHPFGHICIVMTGHPNIACIDFAGEIALERSTMEAVNVARWRLANNAEALAFPLQDMSLDASYVRYHVACGPLGWDFFTWLMDAEMTRVREGAPGPLKVAFWLGREKAQIVNTDARTMWLNNVFRPALKLIGAVEDEGAMYGRCRDFYLHGPIVKAARNGEAVPRIKPPQHAVDFVNACAYLPGCVTITLREAEHWPHRNSNVAAWLRFARDLEAQGERVVFVRDTAKAHEPIEGFHTCPDASKDVLIRAALYEAASVNLFVSNGVGELARFGSKPYLIFVGVEAENSPYRYNTPEWWRDGNGVAVGEQVPWSAPDQRLVWNTDTYQNIVSAWNDLRSALRKAA